MSYGVDGSHVKKPRHISASRLKLNLVSGAELQIVTVLSVLCAFGAAHSPKRLSPYFLRLADRLI